MSSKSFESRRDCFIASARQTLLIF